jgi:hypothetical protein
MLVAVIEERFLSARADAFTGSECEEKASARFARNDRLGFGRKGVSGRARSF